MHAAPQMCLIVDDDPHAAAQLRAIVERAGMEVCGVVHDGATAIESAINFQPDVILIDVQLGGELDGVDAAVEIVERTRARIVFTTVDGDASIRASAMRKGASSILVKPIDPEELRFLLRC